MNDAGDQAVAAATAAVPDCSADGGRSWALRSCLGRSPTRRALAASPSFEATASRGREDARRIGQPIAVGRGSTPIGGSAIPALALAPGFHETGLAFAAPRLPMACSAPRWRRDRTVANAGPPRSERRRAATAGSLTRITWRWSARRGDRSRPRNGGRAWRLFIGTSLRLSRRWQPHRRRRGRLAFVGTS